MIKKRCVDESNASEDVRSSPEFWITSATERLAPKIMRVKCETLLCETAPILSTLVIFFVDFRTEVICQNDNLSERYEVAR